MSFKKWSINKNINITYASMLYALLWSKNSLQMRWRWDVWDGENNGRASAATLREQLKNIDDVSDRKHGK